MADVESKHSDNILYDLSVLAEWRAENEIFTRSNRDKPNTSLFGRASSLVRRSTWTFLRVVGIPMQMPTPCLLPEQLLKLKNSQLPWKIAVSSTGTMVAIAQESFLEIRSQRDNLESVLGRGIFPQDPYSQWRCLTWSEDETMVACSRSSGAVDVFDILGTLLFTIPGVEEEAVSPMDLSEAVAALIFTDYKPDEKWAYELLVINYHGSMSSYFVHRDNSFQLRYTFLFATEYPRGISSVVYAKKHKVLFVGGGGLADSLLSPSKSRQEGISAWRLLSDSPYCKLITDYEEDKYKAKLKLSFLSKLKVSYVWNNLQADGIFHLCLSPCGTTLASIHFSGKLALWEVPSLYFRREFDQNEQPGWEEISPELLENPVKKKRIKDLIPHKQLIDVNFWSDEHMILARCSGAVSVVSLDNLDNLLGVSPEWFEPSPQLTQALNGGFLGMECEINFPKRRIVVQLNDGGGDEEDDSDEEDLSFMTKTTRMSKQILYYLTDSEHFQPLKKKPKFVTKVYRVVSLKSTTPEELYARKIDAEEYGEALSLAQAYKLDCDLVYQRQWRKSQVSKASIEDYLSKISKRSWVLHECLERVPETIGAMQELLEYGLNGTDLPALIAIGKGEDHGQFIICDPDDGLYDEIYDPFDPQSLKEKEKKRAQIRKSNLEQIDFKNLNLEQKELCRARLKFFNYLDRLKTYEYILGGPNAASERYNAGFYSSFRSQNIYDLVVEYAQNNDWRAVETLLIYHSSELAPHRLAILSHFPETADPNDYKSLLPKLDEDDGVVPWEVDFWRETDWSEKDYCRSVIDLGSEDEAFFLYKDISIKYRTASLTCDLVQEWYHERACEIERRSRLVEFAIELVKLGIERGIDNLLDLLDDLVTMEMMVYECGVDASLQLHQLREMADYDRLELIMAKSPEEMYIKNLHRWMVPFLQRCEKKEPGAYNRLLRDFVLTKAKNDLTFVLKIFEASKPSNTQRVIKSQDEVLSLGLDAIYCCERDDQLELIMRILECLHSYGSGSFKDSPECLLLHKQVDKLDHHVHAARIFQDYGMKMTIANIKLSEGDPSISKSLIIKLTRLASKRSIPLNELEWHKLDEDVLTLQSQVYNCISPALCQEVFVESLMCSGLQETIRLAGQLMERSSGEPKHSQAQKGPSIDKVPYAKAVNLSLSAAQEYFDSSSNLSDSCMDLARSCLNLILDSPKPIQEELDLIASLALLDEFGVAVLPLQVRLCKNRMELVKTAVTTKPTSYKQTQRLLRLGQLLGIYCKDPQELEGQILQMAADAAVNALDYEFAYQCCERLISLCHSSAWSICVRLAEQEGFRNIVAKAKLLSFAMTYCSKDKILPVLQARCLLETQILYEQVSKVVSKEPHLDSPDSRESPFSAHAAIKQTQQILSSTKQTTTAVLSSITDTKWLHNAVKSLKHSVLQAGPSKPHMVNDRGLGNCGLQKQGCHPFYAGIIEHCYEDVKSVDFASCQSGDEPGLSAKILRTAKLDEMLTCGLKQQPASEVLLELAKQTIYTDATLGLAFLLATSKSQDVSCCFEDFPSTDISLQLAVYYYAIQIYNTLQPLTSSHVYALYRQTPSKVISRVFDFISTCTGTDWPAEVNSFVLKLKSYQEMLEDYNQACMLQSLGKGVNVIRFSEDSEYKKETIFGLAMNLDDEVYNIALSLAQRYDMNMWDVYMCHLEYLFSDSGLSLEDLQTRVTKLDILPTLKGQMSEFCDRMTTQVYPTLAGTDLKSLCYFFTLVESVEDKLISGLPPAKHAALLKKFKSSCPNLDYKKLIDANTDPLEVLQPCLTANNINTLAKLASQIPNKKGGFLHPGSVYSCWASQVFWMGDGSKKSSPSNMDDWIRRYESIGEHIQKLRPDDLLWLIDSLVFTASSRKTLDLPCREEISKRAVAVSRKNCGSKKEKLDTNGEISWENCTSQLETRLEHLKTLSSETIQSFAQATDPTFASYAQQYDLSKGDIMQVKLLLVQMILDGQAVELVDDVLQVTAASSLTTQTIVKEAVSIIASALRGKEMRQEIIVRKSLLEVLQQVVENVREHQDNGGSLVQAEDVMSLLRPFCSDSSIQVPQRLDVLKVLEKSFDLSATDKTLLTLYRTDALVTSGWPDKQISEDMIISEEARAAFFSSLLQESNNKHHLVTCAHLLILWPPFSPSYSSNPDTNPWVKMLKTIVSPQGESSGEIIYDVIKNECSIFPLDIKCTDSIVDLLIQDNQHISGVKLALRSCYPQLVEKGLKLLENISENLADADLMAMLLKNNLTARVVSMPVYSPLVAHVLQHQGQPELPAVDTIVAQLDQAGFKAEAGSLLLQARLSHSKLLTFNSALASVRRWFKN